MSNNDAFYAPSSCRPYCNNTGYYADGFGCDRRFCCGNLTYRYCCTNALLEVPSYPDKCHCPMSTCAQLSWDILLPCVAAALFVFLTITICCCHGFRRRSRCRQWLLRRCLGHEEAAAAPEPSPTNPDSTRVDVGVDPSFPHLPPYEFGPPKYDSLELTEAPPKYEEAMRQHEIMTTTTTTTTTQPRQHYDNAAFVDDAIVTPYGDVAQRSCDVTHLDSDSLRTMTLNDCSTSQGQVEGRPSGSTTFLDSEASFHLPGSSFHLPGSSFHLPESSVAHSVEYSSVGLDSSGSPGTSQNTSGDTGSGQNHSDV